MSQALSALEQLKRDVNPYAGQEVFARLARGTVADITPEDDLVMRWHGLYRHRPQEAGVFMLRLKLPGGALSTAQATTVAALAEQFSNGHLSLTTRQDIELHQLTLADLPTVFAELAAVGLRTLGACGDQVRNVVACPVSGIDPAELLDTAKVGEELTAAFLANPAFANLPRKFKIALCGCAQHCVPSEINDLAFEAALDGEGRPGFTVLIGGGLSAHPVMAADLGVWVPVEDAVAVVSRAVEIFRDHGNREQRGQARVKHLVAKHGVAWFREEMERRLGRALPSRATPVTTASHQDHLGVHPQYDPALVYLGIPVPGGLLTSDQLQALAAIAGDGRLRVTHQQNLILADIPRVNVESVLTQVDALGLPVEPTHWRGRVVVCTGKDFCNKALVHTKAAALHLAEALDVALPMHPISIRMSGCPNGCGQHAIADIGLQGTVVRNEAGTEERFDLWVGGGEAAEPAFGRRIAARLHPEQLANVVGDLWSRYQAEALDEHETFSTFARRVLWNGSPAA
ncbi:MAG TPA: nitrite/sulfite reductase [Armatimonadota bacterium]|jgi:ferredoxin-nitrite reductase